MDENGEPWADTWEPARNIEVEENEALLETFKKKQAQKQSQDPPNKKVKKEATKKKGRPFKVKNGSDNETDYNPNSGSESKPKRKPTKEKTADAQAKERQKAKEKLHHENIQRQKVWSIPYGPNGMNSLGTFKITLFPENSLYPYRMDPVVISRTLQKFLGMIYFSGCS